MRSKRYYFRTGLVLVAFLASRVAAAETNPAPAAPAASALRDPDDGQFDVSAFLDKAYGFVPVLVPITEPAVGYGAGGGLVFIDKPIAPVAGEFARPNISAVGGFATENGSWGVFAGDSRNWHDGRIQTLVGGLYASVNLDYYSTAEAPPLRYNLTPAGGLVRSKFQLGKSRFWGGLAYALATTGVTFNDPAGTPGLPAFESNSRVGGLIPSLFYDSRDNIFTPTRGMYAEVNAGLFSENLGSDRDFQRVTMALMYYRPLLEKWTLGLRGDLMSGFGDIPFYLRPFIMLRGVAAMRYQGDDVAQGEAELRWQFSGRYSLVGFGGVGQTWTDTRWGQREESAATYGAGFRYEIARKYGLHMGVDVAFGPDDPILYIQFGSAWMRP